MLPAHTPTTIPTKQRIEDTQLYIKAFFTDIPARNNTAKSPVNDNVLDTGTEPNFRSVHRGVYCIA